MSSMGTFLRGVRLEKRIDLDRMASALGTTADRLERVERSAEFPPLCERRRWALKLGFADVFEFDARWRDRHVRLTTARRDNWIPVINCAPAGSPVDYEEFGIDSGVGFDYVPRREGQLGPLFAVVILGDSMEPDYYEGDLVIFRPLTFEDIAEEGSALFVRFGAARDHGCTFKRVFHEGPGRLRLEPTNRRYSSLIVSTEEIDRIAMAIEKRPGYWEKEPAVRRADEYAQDGPES